MRIISASEAARVLGIRKDSILTLLDKGEIPAQKLGTRWKIDEQQLEDWFRSKSIMEAEARRESKC